jgi:hypothetical protein
MLWVLAGESVLCAVEIDSKRKSGKRLAGPLRRDSSGELREALRLAEGFS